MDANKDCLDKREDQCASLKGNKIYCSILIKEVV